MKQEEKIRSLVTSGNGSKKRFKGNTAANGVISLPPDFDDATLTKAKIDTFVKGLTDASQYIDQIERAIYGATMMEWSMGENNSKLQLILDCVRYETRREDRIALNNLKKILEYRLRKNSILQDLCIEITSIALVVNDPQVHSN